MGPKAEISGSVTSLNAELGKSVHKGETLARIEDHAVRISCASARAAVRSASVDVQNSSRQVERTEALVKAGALPPRDLEMAQGSRLLSSQRLCTQGFPEANVLSVKEC